MIEVKVKSSKFGEFSQLLPDGGNLRLYRLRMVQDLGAVLKDAAQDTNGDISFMVPENMVDKFTTIVESFS